MKQGHVMPNDSVNVYERPRILTPVFKNLESGEAEKPKRKRSWLLRQSLGLGTHIMADTDRQPDNGNIVVNRQKVLFLIAIMSTIAGGFWVTHDRIENSGYERGRQEERIIQQKNIEDEKQRVQKEKDDELQRQIIELQKELKTKKELELLNKGAK